MPSRCCTRVRVWGLCPVIFFPWEFFSKKLHVIFAPCWFVPLCTMLIIPKHNFKKHFLWSVDSEKWEREEIRGRKMLSVLLWGHVLQLISGAVSDWYCGYKKQKFKDMFKLWLMNRHWNYSCLSSNSITLSSPFFQFVGLALHNINVWRSYLCRSKIPGLQSDRKCPEVCQIWERR